MQHSDTEVRDPLVLTTTTIKVIYNIIIITIIIIIIIIIIMDIFPINVFICTRWFSEIHIK